MAKRTSEPDAAGVAADPDVRERTTVHYLVVAALCLLLLLAANPPTRLRRIATIVVAGTIGTTFITLADPIWFHLPWDYAVGTGIYEMVSWIVLGAIVGWITPVPVTPSPSQASGNAGTAKKR